MTATVCFGGSEPGVSAKSGWATGEPGPDAVAGEITAELAVFLHYDRPKGFEPPPPTPAPFQRLSDEVAATLPPIRIRPVVRRGLCETPRTVCLSS